MADSPLAETRTMTILKMIQEQQVQLKMLVGAMQANLPGSQPVKIVAGRAERLQQRISEEVQKQIVIDDERAKAAKG